MMITVEDIKNALPDIIEEVSDEDLAELWTVLDDGTEQVNAETHRRYDGRDPNVTITE